MSEPTARTAPRVRPRFAWRLAIRELRHGFRRVGVYMASITLGVGALVSIHSFRDDVARSVQEEADVLMGANARLAGDAPLPANVESVLDSLGSAGAGVARVTTATSMVFAPASNMVRLLQVRALDEGYPYYGDVTTRPAGAWGAHLEPGRALVDPAVLTQLAVDVGDTLIVGLSRLEIAGTVDDLPTDLAYQTAIGPRVHVSQATLAESQLLVVGSLARYEAFLRLPDIGDRRAVRERYDSIFDAADVGYTLAEEQAQSLSNGVRFLGRFLGLVGLGALLLGGVGVASAIHVYIREKRAAIAVLRCIGAHQGTAFAAYLLQAALLGLGGALAGVVVGIGAQALMPTVLANVLPVDVTTRFSIGSAAAGLGIGVWVALIFALIPLLGVRDVPPLAALRHDFEPGGRRVDALRLVVYALAAGSVVLLCTIEAPEPEVGLGFAGALAAAAVLVSATGWLLTRAARRWFPAGAPYPVRQGVSNLFRPQNQTLSVTLALGFGAFVIGTIVEVGGSIRDELTLSFGAGQPNVLLFDVQRDQVDGVLALMPESVRPSADVTPLVTSRIAAINGRTPDELRQNPNREERPEGWAVRREYRNTYRPFIGPAEQLVRGRWWDGTPGSEDDTTIDSGDLAGVSLEEDVAVSLRADLGDTITWEVSGIDVPTVVTSIRRVDWERLEPNFFAVVEPGVLEAAPQTIVMVARLPDETQRAALQRELIGRFPNVSALDFSRVQEAIDTVLSRVRQAVAFLGAFSALAGVIVLLGALATSRVQRLREGALLKTLGARRPQVLTVLLSEYIALGTVATASGLVLAVVGAAIVVPTVFEMAYAPSVGALALIWIVVGALTVVVGILGSRDLLRRAPLPVLREAPE
ncbi:MAG: FtsX-like permease family protein [Gemmatimonadetes bacterium]|nr:FtsX-like permease family protein [Gemmatimonadota bacterium]